MTLNVLYNHVCELVDVSTNSHTCYCLCVRIVYTYIYIYIYIYMLAYNILYSLYCFLIQSRNKHASS